MASKKKLRKQIRDLEMRLIGSQVRVSSLKADIHTLIEGKDIDRIEQIRIRSNIEYGMDQSVWFGSRVTTYPEVSDNLARTYFGNGFFRQIVDSASEYEEMNQVDTDRSEFFSKELVETVGLFDPGGMTEKEFADLILLKPIPGSEADRGFKYPELSDMKGRRSGMKTGAAQMRKGVPKRNKF